MPTIDPTPEEINKRLDELEGVVSIGTLSDRYGLEPRKIRALLRKQLGLRAVPNPNDPSHRPQYLWSEDDPALWEIQELLERFSK
jgi:hypothetical protein